jgi:hypothetical protein
MRKLMIISLLLSLPAMVILAIAAHRGGYKAVVTTVVVFGIVLIGVR